MFLPISKDTTGGYESMDCVSHSPHEDAELIPAVDVLLLEAEDDGSEVVVVGEVVPVLGAVEILLIRCLDHAGQLETSVLVPMFLDDRLLPTVWFLNYWQTLGSFAFLRSVSSVNGVKGTFFFFGFFQFLINLIG